MDVPGYDFYTDEDFLGVSIPESEFARYALRAYDALNMLTHGALAEASLEGDDLTKGYKAVCYQADYFYTHGLSIGQGASGESWTVGKVSVSDSASHEEWWAKRAQMVCPYALTLLEWLGLLQRRVAVCP